MSPAWPWWVVPLGALVLGCAGLLATRLLDLDAECRIAALRRQEAAAPASAAEPNPLQRPEEGARA